MDFDTFCAINYLGGREKEQFKRWLGQRATEIHTEAEWLTLFNDWLRDTPRRAVAV